MTIELDAARHQPETTRRPAALSGAPVRVAVAAVDRAADWLVARRVPANAITSAGIALAAVAGVLLGFGRFGWAVVPMAIASAGDALDGMVARRSGTASVGGALLDASGDRYQEFFVLAGLAVFFRQSPPALLMTLFALVGSFMVSYGSAKAEALGGPSPPGAMRRARRAVCMCVGTLLVPPWHWLAGRAGLPPWTGLAPILAALACIALVANVSAVRRLRSLA